MAEGLTHEKAAARCRENGVRFLGGGVHCGIVLEAAVEPG